MGIKDKAAAVKKYEYVHAEEESHELNWAKFKQWLNLAKEFENALYYSCYFCMLLGLHQNEKFPGVSFGSHLGPPALQRQVVLGHARTALPSDDLLEGLTEFTRGYGLLP